MVPAKAQKGVTKAQKGKHKKGKAQKGVRKAQKVSGTENRKMTR
jgi:hypothetical protein